MRLLVSVVDAAEARLAVAGGVDVVDVKNPAEGSLGAPAPAVIAQVRAAVPAELPLSVAIGDLPSLPGTAALAALGAARSGAAYVKIGLWGAVHDGGRGRRAARGARGGRRRRRGGRRRLRRRRARAEPAAAAARTSSTAAREAGVSGCLLDTAVKDGRGLLAWLAPDALAEMVAEAHAAGLEMALAGELRAEDLPAVRATGADIAGVRSAACRDGRRTAPLDPDAHRAAAGGLRARPAATRLIRVPVVRPVSSSSASRAGSRPRSPTSRRGPPAAPPGRWRRRPRPQRLELVDRERAIGAPAGGQAVEARDRLDEHEALGARGARHPRGDRVRRDGPRRGQRIALAQQRGRQEDRDGAGAGPARGRGGAPRRG